MVEVVAQYGMPASSYELGGGERAFVWDMQDSVVVPRNMNTTSTLVGNTVFSSSYVSPGYVASSQCSYRVRFPDGNGHDVGRGGRTAYACHTVDQQTLSARLLVIVRKLNHARYLVSRRSGLSGLGPLYVVESQMQMSFGGKMEGRRQMGCVHDGNHGVRPQTARGFRRIPIVVD